MDYLAFEKPIEELIIKLEKAKEIGLEFMIPDGAMYIFAKINQK